MRGRVKWFSPEKAFGFIAQEAGPDVFVHISAVQAAGLDTLRPGDPLAFETARDARSGTPEAIGLQLLAGAAADAVRRAIPEAEPRPQRYGTREMRAR